MAGGLWDGLVIWESGYMGSSKEGTVLMEENEEQGRDMITKEEIGSGLGVARDLVQTNKDSAGAEKQSITKTEGTTTKDGLLTGGA